MCKVPWYCWLAILVSRLFPLCGCPLKGTALPDNCATTRIADSSPNICVSSFSLFVSCQTTNCKLFCYRATLVLTFRCLVCASQPNSAKHWSTLRLQWTTSVEWTLALGVGRWSTNISQPRGILKSEVDVLGAAILVSFQTSWNRFGSPIESSISLEEIGSREGTHTGPNYITWIKVSQNWAVNITSLES